jgi:hypothetical protein
MGKDSRSRRKRRLLRSDLSTQDSADLGVTPGNVKCAMWGVAFLDLMGYREQLLSTDVFPALTSATEAIELFKDVVGRRRALVDGPKKFFAAAAAAHRSIGGLPPEALQLQKHMSKIRVATTGFADNVVLETPLDDVDRAPIVALHEMVLASAITLSQHLALGSPLRGGIEVGYGMWAYGQLHSGATVTAVNLEKRAGYPRILVGDRFRAYLEHESQAPSTSGPLRIHRAIASSLKRILYRDPLDPPDYPMGIDYLGSDFQALVPGMKSETVKNIWRFAHESLERFRNDPNRAKERGYYERLIAYVEPRLEIWGLDKSVTD